MQVQWSTWTKVQVSCIHAGISNVNQSIGSQTKGPKRMLAAFALVLPLESPVAVRSTASKQPHQRRNRRYRQRDRHLTDDLRVLLWRDQRLHTQTELQLWTPVFQWRPHWLSTSRPSSASANQFVTNELGRLVTIRYEMLKADMSQLNLPHGDDN